MQNSQHQLFMQRCFDLARLGAGTVAPNPMVGAVLVHQGRIIGEGWHKAYGKEHAEVNAVANVQEKERYLIKDSTLYVSLEPCNIHGNTPPCTDLILKERIRRIVLACIDHTKGVNGSGLERLKRKGVEVIYGVLEEKGKRVSAFRNTWAAKNRPFVQLKFAQTKNGYMGMADKQVWISNAFTKRLAHKMRAEFDAILVGTQTALLDNPKLDTRHWYGNSPIRIVLDRELKIPKTHHLFDQKEKTIIITEQRTVESNGSIIYHRFPFDEHLLKNMLDFLAVKGITSLLVEGGAKTLQHFINANFWDEAWIFTGDKLIDQGIAAPQIIGELILEKELSGNVVTIYRNNNSV